MSGKICLVGTPIGNLEDITYRAIRVLKESNIILSEDTRRSLKLLREYSIHPEELISYNSHNYLSREKKIISSIKQNKQISFVSDAGMPVISDPGLSLVNLANENDIEFDVIPGPSAVTTAVAASGFGGSNFIFFGFLPRGKKRRRIFKKISEGLYESKNIVFFDSPYRIKECVEDFYEIVGNREIFIGKELTKLHQKYIFTTVKNLCDNIDDIEFIGELTIVISGREKDD
ncbi:MAG: rRNA (cytidine1402-2-O)-methyltransferase [Kosmotogales bacterium]|nr:rRNA (cytidine1402-2-O)-methyltransferase [Kosmotogales bacterium]